MGSRPTAIPTEPADLYWVCVCTLAVSDFAWKENGKFQKTLEGVDTMKGKGACTVSVGITQLSPNSSNRWTLAMEAINCDISEQLINLAEFLW